MRNLVTNKLNTSQRRYEGVFWSKYTRKGLSPIVFASDDLRKITEVDIAERRVRNKCRPMSRPLKIYTVCNLRLNIWRKTTLNPTRSCQIQQFLRNDRSKRILKSEK